jgi:hypothetical protein
MEKDISTIDNRDGNANAKKENPMRAREAKGNIDHVGAPRCHLFSAIPIVGRAVYRGQRMLAPSFWTPQLCIRGCMIPAPQPLGGYRISRLRIPHSSGSSRVEEIHFYFSDGRRAQLGVEH